MTIYMAFGARWATMDEPKQDRMEPPQGQDMKDGHPQHRERKDVWQDDTSAFHHFYKAPMGRVVRHLITRKLSSIISEPQTPKSDQRLALGIGYARPYLRFLDQRYGYVVGLQSAGIIPAVWPSRRPGRMASIEEHALPVLASTVDTVLMVHGLETAPDPSALLQECWRILEGMGRLIVVVPHRGSMWAGREVTPFGYGQPYSINQIRSLLKTHDFEVKKVHQALVAPPSETPFYPRFAPFVERLPNPLGGVLIVDAVKMIYSVRGISVSTRKQVRPALVGINTNMIPRISDKGEVKGQ